MAHPFQDKRADKVESERVKSITKGYAAGGAVINPKVGSKDRLPVANVAGTKAAGEIGGAKAKQRLDRPAFASGGKVKGSGKTNVTVIVAPPDKSQDQPPMPPMMPPPGPPPMPPPRPPMVPPPPGGAPPGGPPPSGMPIRATGGRVKAASERMGTKVSHTPGKGDLGMIMGKPATAKKDGGRVHKFPSFDAGAGSGEGRIEKEEKYG